jgi:anhydro-N-acetylmuramic acid kinase
LNLGGIANLTLLPRAKDAAVRGFDTGPASCLLDAWAAHHLGTGFDRDGLVARGGSVDRALLDRLLDYPYFRSPPPKSSGREEFDLAWLSERAPTLGNADMLATLTELTARSVVDALRAHGPDVRRVIACGGGVHNGFLMQRLQALLQPVVLETTAAYGIDPDYVEAALFAWLARQTMRGAAGNLPSVTGAAGPRVLGAVHPA